MFETPPEAFVKYSVDPAALAIMLMRLAVLGQARRVDAELNAWSVEDLRCAVAGWASVKAVTPKWGSQRLFR